MDVALDVSHGLLTTYFSQQGAKAPSEVRLPAAAAQLTKVLAGLRHTFVVADATLPDMPLVFASEG